MFDLDTIKYFMNKFFCKNNIVFYKDGKNGAFKKANKHQVNINAWVSDKDSLHNLGDWLSVIVVEKLLEKYDIEKNKQIAKTKHLYAIGSILPGWQDATIWGSGFINDMTKNSNFKFNLLHNKFFRKTDIRALRGPESKRVFEALGKRCPNIFGDPALLISKIYNPKPLEKKPFLVIPHYDDYNFYKEKYPTVSIMTDDWEKTIDEICSAELVISSSLHGIILAEAYSIPAVYLKGEVHKDIFKYNDYYYSTGRYKFPIVSTVEEALNTVPSLLSKDVLEKMQQDLLSSFPIDLWN